MQEARDPRWEWAGNAAGGMAYVRQTMAQGQAIWELVGWEGESLKSSTNRSSIFFYAAEIGVDIVCKH